MAAGTTWWCALPLPPNLSSSPWKVGGIQEGLSSRALCCNQKVKRGKAGSWVACNSPSPPLPLSVHKCRTANYEKIQLDRAGSGQQHQFGREAAARRLQSPSRGAELLRSFCKPSWKETSADFISTISTGANSKPTLDPNLPSETRRNAYQSGKLKFWIVTVSTCDEFLAAATLRAQLFYSYPKFSPSGSEGLEGIKARLKHDFAVQDLLKSRVKSESERDTKMQDLNMNVKCLLAVCEEPNHDELLLSSKDKSNSLLTPPAVNSLAFSRKPLVAIGTLDIQVSEKGPGHKLLSFSSKREAQVRHGYIFNLCVTEASRRHGVATALMKEAVHVAQQIQIRVLYVHVEAYNNSALALYQKLGYIVEEEEPLDVEYRFQRPRRILLSYHSQ